MPVSMMKAVVQHGFGGPDVLCYDDVPVPRLSPGEVLVRVRAVGINPPDWYLREGYKTLPPEWRPAATFPLILGTDISGVVTAVADDVEGFALGDEVYAMVRFPEGMAGGSRAYAEYVTVPARELALKPAGVDHAHAAAAPMSLLTAWQFLVDLGHDEPNAVQPGPHRPVDLKGKTVVINGAAGGVGHFLVQVAKLKGARVIAIASGRHVTMLKDLGADEVLDYTNATPEDELRDVDLVVDAVGGPTSSRFLKTIKRGGALFPVFPLGFAGAAEAEQRGLTVSATQVRSNGAQLRELASLLDSGAIRVVIDGSWPLADAAKAHERAAQGHIQGKLVLIVE
ncbi:NADPH:quinone reductase [Luteibacter sp. UNCMF331Sha3.1]|uniref:NADP-dependent oxidoreductase n=1 Tax=Luteibacter sp. UNCMF331Sha3.1 TaxID=1502760 RepID=UPI0008D69EF6|nr:NADP-dependent oxidoreductase [Luteibacter sp. UNCMF331Sha3.1]SEM40048.1 NADPH:quinone reductase [Luteibacter sp. UNCMF331Sha3.1]